MLETYSRINLQAILLHHFAREEKCARRCGEYVGDVEEIKMAQGALFEAPGFAVLAWGDIDADEFACGFYFRSKFAIGGEEIVGAAGPEIIDALGAFGDVEKGRLAVAFCARRSSAARAGSARKRAIRKRL